MVGQRNAGAQLQDFTVGRNQNRPSCLGMVLPDFGFRCIQEAMPLENVVRDRDLANVMQGRGRFQLLNLIGRETGKLCQKPAVLGHSQHMLVKVRRAPLHGFTDSVQSDTLRINDLLLQARVFESQPEFLKKFPQNPKNLHCGLGRHGQPQHEMFSRRRPK